MENENHCVYSKKISMLCVFTQTTLRQKKVTPKREWERKRVDEKKEENENWNSEQQIKRSCLVTSTYTMPAINGYGFFFLWGF